MIFAQAENLGMNYIKIIYNQNMANSFTFCVKIIEYSSPDRDQLMKIENNDSENNS